MQIFSAQWNDYDLYVKAAIKISSQSDGQYAEIK